MLKDKIAICVGNVHAIDGVPAIVREKTEHKTIHVPMLTVAKEIVQVL